MDIPKEIDYIDFRMEKNVKSRDSVLTQRDCDSGLREEVLGRCGVNPGHCYSCLACSGGCPFYRIMDYGPHGVMRLVILGLRREVLECGTLWLCVGCHTCSAVCPMAIDVAAIMDALRRMALEEDRPVAEPAILDFHREVLESVQRYGRTHKLEIMLRYKLHQGSWLQDMGVGLKMLAKRKLDLRPSRVRAPDVLVPLFRDSTWRRTP